MSETRNDPAPEGPGGSADDAMVARWRQDAGRRKPILTDRQRFARLAKAWFDFDGSTVALQELMEVVAQTVEMFPVRDCRACGIAYVQLDGRHSSGFCSTRCRYRIAKREERARLKAHGRSEGSG